MEREIKRDKERERERENIPTILHNAEKFPNNLMNIIYKKTSGKQCQCIELLHEQTKKPGAMLTGPK